MAAAAAATTRAALATLPELSSADGYEAWKTAVETAVDGMSADPNIAPGFRAAFDAHVAAAGAPAYNQGQQICLSLMNASAASKVKCAARSAIGIRTSVDEIIRFLNGKRGWGHGDLGQQEERVQQQYNLYFDPAKHMDIDKLCSIIESETRKCGPRFPTDQEKADHNKRILLNAIRLIPGSQAVIIPNKPANISYDQAQESVEQWWRDTQLADGQKNGPEEKLFPAATQVPIQMHVPTTSSKSEQVLHAKIMELEAERDRLREDKKTEEQRATAEKDKQEIKDFVMAVVAANAGQAVPENNGGNAGGGGGGRNPNKGGGKQAKQVNKALQDMKSLQGQLQGQMQAFATYGFPLQTQAGPGPMAPQVPIQQQAPRQGPYTQQQLPTQQQLFGQQNQQPQWNASSTYGKAPRSGGCHKCGGPHFIRDCPNNF